MTDAAPETALDRLAASARALAPVRGVRGVWARERPLAHRTHRSFLEVVVLVSRGFDPALLALLALPPGAVMYAAECLPCAEPPNDPAVKRHQPPTPVIPPLEEVPLW